MVDRAARDRMAEAIRSYMDEGIWAFDFDDLLEDIRATTEDGTVLAARRQLWSCYDDVKDHPLVASKQEWDYFNRLLLLLESDAEIEEAVGRSWHASQFVAAAFLICYAGFAVYVGWKPDLLALAFPLGVVSMVLGWFNGRRRRKSFPPARAVLYPFPSLASLRFVRRTVGSFARARYPEDISGRRIRHPIEDVLLRIPAVFGWLLGSPVILFIQALPEKEFEMAVRMHARA